MLICFDYFRSLFFIYGQYNRHVRLLGRRSGHLVINNYVYHTTITYSPNAQWYCNHRHHDVYDYNIAIIRHYGPGLDHVSGSRARY